MSYSNALKVTQKVAKLASTGKAGPIALKSGYLRFVVKADAHIEVGGNPTVSTTNSLFVASGESVILKESVASAPTVGVTNASQAIKFNLTDGMSSPFAVGDRVVIENKDKYKILYSFNAIVLQNYITKSVLKYRYF